MIYLTINTVPEILCFIAAMIFLFKDKEPAWRMLIVYLFLTCFTELTGVYIRKVLFEGNLFIYNIYILAECFFVSTFFYYLYQRYPHKKWWVAWPVVFLLMYITEMFYNDFDNFVSITASVMSVVFVLASLLYFYNKLKDEHFEPLLTSGQFWWVSGTLCFYFGSTVCNLFFDFLMNNEVGGYDRSIRYLIFNILNVILYISWSYSFLCRYRQRKLSS
jgi:hypothetical protein